MPNFLNIQKIEAHNSGGMNSNSQTNQRNL